MRWEITVYKVFSFGLQKTSYFILKRVKGIVSREPAWSESHFRTVSVSKV